jgi:outer membrane protein assembly factor BamB
MSKAFVWNSNHSGARWVAVFLSCAVFTAAGAEWTQYRGPNHDGSSKDRIKKQWSGSITNPVWLVYLTNGITGLTVSQGRVFTEVASEFDEYGQAHKEYCIALSAADGQMLWSTEIDSQGTSAALDPRLYPNGGVGATDDGPRATPATDGGSVYVLSSYHKLYRLNATNGAVIWQRDLVSQFGGGVIPWQSAASPVLENGLIYVNANCATSNLMAFNATDGALVWRSQNAFMTHSTPVLATMFGVRQLIFATQPGLISVNPQTGSFYWKYPVPYNGISIGSSPLVCGDVVFITSNYGYGGFATRISYSNPTFTATTAWSSGSQESHWSTPVYYQGCIFGTFVPDFDQAELRCVEAATGTTRWAVPGFGRGGTLLVGTNLLLLTERGDLVLAQANTNSYVELGRFQAIPNYQPDFNKCWNAFAVSDGNVYARSTAYAARYDLSIPALKFDPPQFATPNTLQLTIRTVTGTGIDASRLTGMQLRASTNAALSPALWTPLPNTLTLTNGFIRVTNVDAGAPRRYFIMSEPE